MRSAAGCGGTRRSSSSAKPRRIPSVARISVSPRFTAYAEARRGGRLAAVAEAVHRRQQDAVRERLDHVAVAVLDLSGERQIGDAPLDEPRGHRFHFFTVTVVPRPTSETMSNSSVSRLTPGSPRPRPLEVEKPFSRARATLGIPGPSSRATTMIQIGRAHV